MKRLREFIIALVTAGMSLPDVHILTEGFALRHKTIFLSIIKNKLVSIESIEYKSSIYN